MQLTLNSDFLDEWCEPSEAEFQPLLDFEEAIQNQSPFHNLDSLTGEIRRGFLDYVRQGIMLHAIRRYRLYKGKFKDFKSYCEQGLGRGHFYCKQIIKAASVCLRLIKSGFKILPNCVAQALPLAKYAAVDQYGDSPLESKWQEVVDVIPREKITAVTIAEIVEDNPEPRLQQVRMKKSTYDVLAKKAAAAGLSFVEFLDRIADEYNPPPDDEEPTDHTPEQLEILDQLDAEFEESATGAIGKSEKPPADLASNKLSTCHQKAINSGRSDTASDSS